VGNGDIFNSNGDTMNLKLYQGFGLVAIASALVALVRIGLGQDRQEVLPVNLAAGAFCLVMMILLSYRERRKIERRS